MAFDVLSGQGAMRRAALILTVTCVLTVMAGPRAYAGTYHVIACSGSSGIAPITLNANNSWVQIPASPPPGLEAFVACPPQGSDQHDGVVAEDHIPGPPNAAAGAEVYWRFAAPAGTAITNIAVTRFLGKEGDQSWRPYGRADGAIFDTCDIASGQDVCQNQGDANFPVNNASTIDYGIRCDASSACGVGFSLHSVWMSLYSADVSVTDPSGPTLTGGPTGPLWNPDAYHRGGESASFGGTDNTGISEADWFIDGRQQSFDRGACDYSRPLPCSDMPADTQHGVNLGAFRDGQHQLEAVVKDAAGNQATAGPINLNVDTTPPAAPGGLAAAPAGDGSFTASWANPDGQFAPITKAHYQLCPVAPSVGPCQGEQTATGSSISSIAGLHLPGPGTWSLIVWLEDAAGNVGSGNTASLVLGPGQTGILASAGITLAKAKLDRHRHLAVLGRAATDLAAKLSVRYRYRPGKHRRVRSITKSAAVHRGSFVAHLKLPAAARRVRKGTLTVSYPGDTTHSPAKLNQRVKLRRS
jgi:hypothetical protein